MFIFTQRKEKEIKKKKLKDFRDDYKNTSKEDLIDKLIIVRSDLEKKSSVEFTASYVVTIAVNIFAFGLGMLNLIAGVVSAKDPGASINMMVDYPNLFMWFGVLAFVLYLLFGFLFNIHTSNREILKIEELVLEEKIQERINDDKVKAEEIAKKEEADKKRKAEKRANMKLKIKARLKRSNRRSR